MADHWEAAMDDSYPPDHMNCPCIPWEESGLTLYGLLEIHFGNTNPRIEDLDFEFGIVL